ncbi:MAG: response regulator transcription factor [Gemmiger sp.]|nr:response regulator transcription factor [Gemmiger sp.]
MNKILIIDDDVELCALLKKAVYTENIQADCCYSGSAGLEAACSQSYQLTVLDVMMPGVDGFAVLEKLRAKRNVPIMMITAKNDNASKVRGLRMGADDYLTKPFEISEFVARVLSLVRRYTLLNTAGKGQVLQYRGLTIDVENRYVALGGEPVNLLPKEFEMLVYFAQNQGKILTKKQIYENVWKNEYLYDGSNIMVQISRLRKKIGADAKGPNGAQYPNYIETIKGVGYRFNKEV